MNNDSEEEISRSKATGRSKVAVLFTRPESVLDDVAHAMWLADSHVHLPKDRSTILKVNISWQHYYPACSTTPWQLEGVIRSLLADGYPDLVPAQNGTVVVDSFEGERNNKHDVVLDRYNLKSVHLDVPPQRWVPYEPKSEMLVLNDVFPEGLMIPELFYGRNIVQLPTFKTHVFTTMTGAMKNAFGGLLNRKRHWTHSVIHETLVDLLAIQKELHPGLFAVMDGTFAGDGPGPRAMRIHDKSILLASADQVAIDAVASKLMGFDPMSIKKLNLAHEKGLGIANPNEINCVGDDISNVNWNFAKNENTFASIGQKLIYHGPLKPFEGLLLRSFISPWAYTASNIYHNGIWRPLIGKRRISKSMKTKWGKFFSNYQ